MTLRMPVLLWCLAPLLVLGPALTCVAPHCMAPLFIACGIIGLAADAIARRSWPKPDLALLALAAATMIWGAISYLWALSPENVVSKLGQFAGVFGTAVFLHARMGMLEANERKIVGRMLVAGTVLGLCLYYSEWATNFMFYDMIRGGVSFDAIDNKQNKAVVLLAVWGLQLFPYLWPVRGWATRSFYAALVLAIAVATVFSPSNSAILVLFVIPLLFIVLRFIPFTRAMIVLAAAGIIATSFGMLPISRAIILHTNAAYDMSVSSSVRARLQIWDQAARRIMEHPLRGWGLNSSPFLPNRDEMINNPSGPSPIAHLHPHNAPLQIWFELGLPGMLLVSAFFVLMCRRILAANTISAQRFGVLALVSLFLYTLSIWGIWQTWFMASLCFAGIMSACGIRQLETRQN